MGHTQGMKAIPLKIGDNGCFDLCVLYPLPPLLPNKDASAGSQGRMPVVGSEEKGPVVVLQPLWGLGEQGCFGCRDGRTNASQMNR